MANLASLQNVFTKTVYPPDENNVSLVPYKDIQGFLVQEFGESGYTCEVTQAGQTNEGNYLIISLTLNLETGKITIPGAAQGKISMAGLLASAIRNAVLRHLGAGTELYEHEEGEEPKFANANPPPKAAGIEIQNPFKDSQTNSYPNKPAGNYRPWDGNLVIKSGKLAGVAWKDVPMSDIHRLSGFGNDMAMKELARRQEAYS